MCFTKGAFHQVFCFSPSTMARAFSQLCHLRSPRSSRIFNDSKIQTVSWSATRCSWKRGVRLRWDTSSWSAYICSASEKDKPSALPLNGLWINHWRTCKRSGIATAYYLFEIFLSLGLTCGCSGTTSSKLYASCRMLFQIFHKDGPTLCSFRLGLGVISSSTAFEANFGWDFGWGWGSPMGARAFDEGLEASQENSPACTVLMRFQGILNSRDSRHWIEWRRALCAVCGRSQESSSTIRSAL